jgi:hypothetical protein
LRNRSWPGRSPRRASSAAQERSFILKTDHRGYFDAVLDLLGSLTIRFDCRHHVIRLLERSTAQSAVAGRAFAGEMTAFEARFVRKRETDLLCGDSAAKFGALI